MQLRKIIFLSDVQFKELSWRLFPIVRDDTEKHGFDCIELYGKNLVVPRTAILDVPESVDLALNGVTGLLLYLWTSDLKFLQTKLTKEQMEEASAVILAEKEKINPALLK